MDNPLTPDQITKINEIAKLPPNEQQKVLPEFLKTLTPEQMDFLKQYQSQGTGEQQCPFCLIAQNKIPTKKVYEDEKVVATLDINPATKGHILVFPKNHIAVLAQIQDTGYLFNTVNMISKIIFEVTKAQGTNILISNGKAAGQHIDHVVVHIIPRFENDKVQIHWDKSEVSQEEFE